MPALCQAAQIDGVDNPNIERKELNNVLIALQKAGLLGDLATEQNNRKIVVTGDGKYNKMQFSALPIDKVYTSVENKELIKEKNIGPLKRFEKNIK
jgi:Iap family predicted aminopeptidase